LGDRSVGFSRHLRPFRLRRHDNAEKSAAAPLLRRNPDRRPGGRADQHLEVVFIERLLLKQLEKETLDENDLEALIGPPAGPPIRVAAE